MEKIDKRTMSFYGNTTWWTDGAKPLLFSQQNGSQLQMLKNGDTAELVFSAHNNVYTHTHVDFLWLHPEIVITMLTAILLHWSKLFKISNEATVNINH